MGSRVDSSWSLTDLLARYFGVTIDRTVKEVIVRLVVIRVYRGV